MSDDEALRTLEAMFPDLAPAGLRRVLLMGKAEGASGSGGGGRVGDDPVSAAVTRVLHFLDSGEEADARMLPLRSEEAREARARQRRQAGAGRAEELARRHVIARYTGTWTAGGRFDGADGPARPHMDQVVTREMRRKRTVMYRDGQVVSKTGERYSVVPKETPEQVRATSVNLAWIKRKRKSGRPGEGKIQ